jgi:hypothetical protein
MIGVFVTFRYEDDFDEAKLQAIAENSRAKFEAMPGLRSKAYTVNAEKREAVNFYVWDSEDAARALFADEFREMVANKYGASPDVEFVQILTLVENRRT